MIIGSRESKLAMRQTEIFISRMGAAHPEVGTEVIGIKSLGDIDLTSPLDQLDNIGAFVRELDEAILDGRIDISVNSLKDIPIEMPEGLTIGAIMKRDSTEDVMLPMALEDLPQGAVLGTASVRRSALIKSVRPDISIAPLRGNIHTRLDKLDRGEYDAIVLAKAGLERMGIERPMFSMDPKVFVPAPAQGAIAVECRSDDKETLALLAAVDDADTRTAVTAERAIMRAMGAGCSSPVGINAKVTADGIAVEAVSFAFTDEPVRLSTVLPAGYTDGDIRRLSSILKGECTE